MPGGFWGGGSISEGPEWSSVCWGLESGTFTCLSIHGQYHIPTCPQPDSSISTFSQAPQTTGSSRGLHGLQDTTGNWASFQGTQGWFWLGPAALEASAGGQTAYIWALGPEHQDLRHSFPIVGKAALEGRKRRADYSETPEPV